MRIVDEFSEITFGTLPATVGPPAPIAMAIFWKRVDEPETTTLSITSPRGETYTVLLPPLKQHFPTQVQINLLTGFCFTCSGSYVFKIAASAGTKQKKLVVRHDPPQGSE